MYVSRLKFEKNQISQLSASTFTFIILIVNFCRKGLFLPFCAYLYLQIGFIGWSGASEASSTINLYTFIPLYSNRVPQHSCGPDVFA
jgi:hypothetical protein